MKVIYQPYNYLASCVGQEQEYESEEVIVQRMMEHWSVNLSDITILLTELDRVIIKEAKSE